MTTRDVPSEKPLLDKLGVKAGMRVAVIDVDDASFFCHLAARTEILDKAAKGVDIIFLGVEGPGDMKRLAKLTNVIARDGAVWVVYRKGQKTFNENDVLRLGARVGNGRREGGTLLGHSHCDEVRVTEGGSVMYIDHIVIGVRDFEAAAAQLRERFGLQSLPVARIRWERPTG